MSSPLPSDPPGDSQALSRAAHAFTELLAAEACLDLTARIEAVVHAAAAEPVFAVEAALRAAWPAAARAAPLGEVVWGLAVPADARLELQAFDAQGRLLLARRYGPGPREAAA